MGQDRCQERNNENENTTSPNQWDRMEAGVRGKFIELCAHKNLERSNIGNLVAHLEALE